MNPTDQAQARAAIHAALKKAAADAAFRAKCLHDPAGALKEAGRMELPAGLKIRFVEKLDEWTIPLPPPGYDPDEISDEALEAIAGGHELWQPPPPDGRLMDPYLYRAYY